MRWVCFFRFHGLLAAAPANGVECGGGPAPGAASRFAPGPPAGEPAGALPPASGPPVISPPVVVLRDGLVWDADRAARARGVRAGQRAAEARLTCPEAVWRPFDPAAAALVLTRAWDLLAAAASVVEPDDDGRPEAYAAWTSGPRPDGVLRAVVAAAARVLPGVDVAVGLAGGRLPARLACPADAGVAVVPPGAEARLLAPVPLRDLAGEGLLPPPVRERLARLGLRRCGEVAALPEALLRTRLGREGARLHALCRGLDDRPVRAAYPPRALSARRAFPDGLPAEAWPAAAGELARRAAEDLRPFEGARRLRLRGAFGAVERVWRAPRRDADLLARAAAELARRTAQGGRARAAMCAGGSGAADGPRAGPRSAERGGEPARAGGPAGLWVAGLQAAGPQAAAASVVARGGADARGSADVPEDAVADFPEDPRTDFLEVRLDDLVAVPPRPLHLLPPPSPGADPAARPALDDLLARLPRDLLRRGAGSRDPYEALLALLDPWGKPR